MNSTATTAGNVCFPDNCTTNLDFLAKSPIFAMSLGAKELFHSNFLAFLLESDDPSVNPIQKKLKELFFGHGKVGRVITWREKNSLDLVIMPAPKECNGKAALDYKGANGECPDSYDTIAVVIEAKFKSIPTQQQLDGYDKKLMGGIVFELDDVDAVAVYDGNDERSWSVMRLKLDKDGGTETCNSECIIEARSKSGWRAGKIGEFKGKVRRILLHPMSSQADCSSEKMGCWKKMSWGCVVEALKCDRDEKLCEIQSETTKLFKCKETVLLPRIICDYRDSLELLLLVLSQTESYVDSSVLKPGKTYGEYYKAITDKQFKARRIHDLVGKYASHILERHVMGIICGALNYTIENETNCADCSSLSSQPTFKPSFGISGFHFTLNSYTFFSNQQPGIGFEWLATQKIGKELKDRKISFGVQIQGNDYRHFISAEGGAEPERTAVLKALEGKLDDTWFLYKHVFHRLPQLSYKKVTKGNEQNNEFYVFGKDKFRYSKADIPDLPLHELAQAVCRSLCIVRQIIIQNNCDVCTSINAFFTATAE